MSPQGVVFQQGKDDSQAGSTTVSTIVLTNSTPAGNLLLALIDWDAGATFTSIGDDIGNVYTQVSVEVNANSTKTRVYWAKNSTTGIRTITINVGAGSTFLTTFVEEYIGQNPTTPIDSFNSTSAAASSNPTISDTTVADLVTLVAYGVATNSNSQVTGFTVRSRQPGGIVVADLSVSPGAQTIKFLSTGTPNWTLWSIGLKPSMTTQVSSLQWAHGI